MTIPPNAGTPEGPFRVDTVDGMTIEWDVPIVVGDGLVLRADVFRPVEEGNYPTILSYGPYGKGVPFEVDYPDAWAKVVQDFPDVLEGSNNKYQVFELVDPERWVPDGYVCVRVDSRGAGRSPGFMDLLSSRETQDLYECIEWAADQPWSNGRVALNGISYFSINAWQVAELQPPHLTAICVWEGAGDFYRDQSHSGGIRNSFIRIFELAIVEYNQHGLADRRARNVNLGYKALDVRNPHTGLLVYGDEALTDEELSANRLHVMDALSQHPFIDEFHRERSPQNWSKVNVPVLSAGNWGGQSLHLRGNTYGWERAGSAEKWLEMHPGNHYSPFYSQRSVDLQKRFLSYYLKDEDTGWQDQPRVTLATRRVDGTSTSRTAANWPLPQTEWTRLYLDAGTNKMVTKQPSEASTTSYQPFTERATFTYVVKDELEFAGPAAAKLFIESATADADLFLIVRVFAPDGTEVTVEGMIDPHTPIAQGWLRASHRALDESTSRPFMPVHPHDHAEPLQPGVVYEVDVEILPTSLLVPAGYSIVLDVQGHDYYFPGATDASGDAISMGAPMSGSGPFIHMEPDDRPAEIYDGRVTVHTGGATASYLLLPVIPEGSW